MAHFVSDLDGLLRHVVTPGPEVLALIALGGVFVVIWRGGLRWLGVAPVMVGFLLWHVAVCPQVLIADSGSLIGVMTDAGRDVSKERGESFAAGNWLENDGAPVAQEVAYGRTGLIEDGPMLAQQIVNVRGSTALAALNGCGGANIIVTNQEMTARSDCDAYDINRLRDMGALAGWMIDGTLTFESVRDRTGNRLWNTQSVCLRGGALAKLIASARQ